MQEVRSRASAFSTVSLAIVISPQIVLRAMSYSQRSTGGFIALGVALATFVAAILVSHRLFQCVPRRLSHQLAQRHIAHWAGLFVAAARILGYALLVILGVELAVGSVNAVVDIAWNAWLDPIFIIVMAIPVLTGLGKWRQSWITGVSIIASLALVVILTFGLAQEAIGAIDFENIRLAREDALATELAPDVTQAYFEAAIGGALVGAVISLISERVMAPNDQRRVHPRALLYVGLAMFFIIGVSLYFVVLLHMPTRRVAIPSLSIAFAFFGHAGQAVLAIFYVVLGLGVVYASYSQLPQLLRELSLDGLLPRRLAAADAIGPRRLIIALIATMAAVVTIILDSARSISAVFVMTVYTALVVTSTAMILRSRSTLNDSVNSAERRTARLNAWLFLGYAVFALTVVIAVVLTQPAWASAGLVALCVPAAFLVAHSRGQSKITEQLRLEATPAGRHLPTRVHGLVLIERVDEATIQAVSWARAMRLSSLTGVVIDIDPVQTKKIRQAWADSLVPVELTILGEPRGALRGPLIEYVRARRENSPNDLIAIFIPRVISVTWAQQFTLRHSTPRVVSDLRREPNVIIAEVPYRLGEEDS